jgi:hypothetical protein
MVLEIIDYTAIFSKNGLAQVVKDRLFMAVKLSPGI